LLLPPRFSLSAFIENVVTSEFAGKPLPLARLRGLTAYGRSLGSLPDRLLDERGRLTAAASPSRGWPREPQLRRLPSPDDAVH